MDLTSQLRNALASQSLPPPSASLLASITSTRNPPPPLAALVATARSRILACDLTAANANGGSSPSSSSASNSNFPVDASSLRPLSPALANPQAREAKLPADVYLQVLDIENIAESRWAQIEELEAIERGERTRGRQVIRVDAEEEEGEDNDDTGQGTHRASSARASGAAPGAAPGGGNATHRLTLQDSAGTLIFALELERMPTKIGVCLGTTCIGAKVLLRAGTTVARRMVLLTPRNCVFLGGKIDAWHEAWVERRLARLKEAVGDGGTRGS